MDRAELVERFQGIDKHFDVIDAHLEVIDVRLEAIDARFDKMDAAFLKMYVYMNERFESLERRIDGLPTKVQFDDYLQALTDAGFHIHDTEVSDAVRDAQFKRLCAWLKKTHKPEWGTLSL